MIISEMTGLFLIPFGVTLWGNAWELLNETNVIFIPLIIVIVREVFDARAQGADEGNASVLCLKRVEMHAWGQLCALMLFVIPMGSQPNYVYKQFSCTANPSIVSGVANVNQMTPASGLTGGGNVLGVSNVSPLMGALNNFGAALSNTLIGTLPCDQGVDVSQVTAHIDQIQPKNDSHKEALYEFGKQCYVRALERYRIAANNKELLLDQLDYSALELQKGYSLFMSPDYKKIYADNHIANGNVPLFMETGNYWFIDSERNSTITCTEAAETIHNLHKLHLKESFRHSQFSGGSQYGGGAGSAAEYPLKKFVAYFQQFGSASEEDVVNDLSHYLFVKEYNSKVSGVDTPSLEDPSASGKAAWQVQTMRQIAANSGYKEGRDAPEVLQGAAVFMGTIFAGVSESVRAYAGVTYVPLISTMLQCLLLAVFPIAVVISGYKFKIAWGLMVTYFGLSLVPFWLNVGMYLASVFSSYSTLPGINTSVDQMKVVGYIFVYTAPVIWMALIQSLGGVAGNTLAQMSGSAMSAVMSGAAVGASQTLKKASNAGSSKYKQDQAAKRSAELDGRVNDLGDRMGSMEEFRSRF
ncbi:hypothetical protein [Vibrio mediterranei]|uniref:hypothetical protein n=1 Tax=Vibrio mediterranei TaxID=689 RepID=UPI004067EAF9